MDVGHTALYVLETIGVIAFALSGAITAIKRELDFFGVIVMGVITAMGGGLIRDVLIGIVPPSLFYSYKYVLLAFIASFLTFVVAYFANKKKYSLKVDVINFINNIFDAVGLGTFSVLGVGVAISAGYKENVFLCVTLGLLTGVGGGALRDIMSRSIPFIFTKRIYAVASIVGCLIYYYMTVCGIGYILSYVVPIVVTFALRMFATVFRWSLPKIHIETENNTKSTVDS